MEEGEGVEVEVEVEVGERGIDEGGRRVEGAGWNRVERGLQRNQSLILHSLSPRRDFCCNNVDLWGIVPTSVVVAMILIYTGRRRHIRPI